MPPGTVTLARAARTTRATLTKVAPSVVTTFKSDEECILSGTPYGSAAQSSDASNFEDILGSKKVSGLADASSLDTASQSDSFDEADSVDSTPTPQIVVPALIADQPNRWCVEGQFQVYTDAKLPNYRV